MKKNKMLSLLFLPLALTGVGVKISLSLQNNNEEIRLQEEGQIWSTIESGVKIKDVSLGEKTSGMIVVDSLGNDHLYMWGENTKGQLGLGYKSDFETLPQEVSYEQAKDYELNNLEIGGDHALLEVTDSNNKSHLYAWGDNEQGQLGTRNNISSTTPQEVWVFDKEIKSISAGKNNSLMVLIDSNGSEKIYAWGANKYGQLGHSFSGEDSSRNYPYQITYFDDGLIYKEIDMSYDFAGAIVMDQSGKEDLYTWGINKNGNLGLNSSAEKITIPKKVNFSNSSKRLSHLDFGQNHSGVVLTNEQNNDYLYTWGNNNYGQLGFSSSGNISYPNRVKSLVSTEIVDVSLGSSHSGVVVRDEKGKEHLYTWGMNTSGELGIGFVDDGVNSGLKEINLPEGNYDIEFGFKDSSVVITNPTDDDNLYVWGKNNSGSLGIGNNNDVYFPKNIWDFSDILIIDTTLIEKVSKNEFIFEIDVPNELILNTNDVEIYNSNGVKIGETTLIEDQEERIDSIYKFDSIVNDVDSVENDYIYWSTNNGEILNLISDEKFLHIEKNNNVFLYSTIGVISIILFIFLVIFVVLLLTRSNEKEDNSNDYLDNKTKKSKKQREKDMMDQRNSVLDAF